MTAIKVKERILESVTSEPKTSEIICSETGMEPKVVKTILRNLEKQSKIKRIPLAEKSKKYTYTLV